MLETSRNYHILIDRKHTFKTQPSMLHDLFTIEVIGKPQGGLNNFEHNCIQHGIGTVFIGILYLKYSVGSYVMGIPPRT